MANIPKIGAHPILQNIVNGPHPAELIILGDAFGLWELTDVRADMKMQHIAKNHRDLFAQLRETGRLAKITLLPWYFDFVKKAHSA